MKNGASALTISHSVYVQSSLKRILCIIISACAASDNCGREGVVKNRSREVILMCLLGNRITRACTRETKNAVYFHYANRQKKEEKSRAILSRSDAVVNIKTHLWVSNYSASRFSEGDKGRGGGTL